jgi:hypothetical protein
MTAGRLGKEQRAEARLLFFVFISLYVWNGRDGSQAKRYAVSRVGGTVCI